MEDRKRTVFVVVIALVLVVALLYSFGLNLFSETPQLELADPNAVESMEPGATSSGEGAGLIVELAPSTVQSIVASLSRYESYSRTLSVTYSWGDDESETITAQVWEDSGWKRTEVTLASGVTENSIWNEDHLWIWYDDGSSESALHIYEGSAAALSSDLLQRLPTYEDVLEQEMSHITAADYVEYDGQPSIYIEVEHQELGYLYRYWISETSGLLMAAETEKSGVLVYQMTSNEVLSPFVGSDETFELPNGTVLFKPD